MRRGCIPITASARSRSLGGEGKAVAALVLRHHERLDGTGYHRYAKAPDLSPAARILAAAEAFQTAREVRPYRAALSDAAAAAKLRGAVKDGKLCADAVEAVLGSAGQPARRAAAERLAGLTPREIEVLRLIAGGLHGQGSGARSSISRRRPPTTTSRTSIPRSASRPAPARPFTPSNAASFSTNSGGLGNPPHVTRPRPGQVARGPASGGV